MRISGGLVFDLEKGFIDRDLFINEDKIVEKCDGEIISAEGCYVIPGLVDVHFHGCVGEDFSDASFDGLARIAEYELSEGVTYICPAGMTLPEKQLMKICKNTADFCENNQMGAEVVGLHLEGPFLSMAKKGAQNSSFLHKPDAAMLGRLLEASGGRIRLVTLAPEEEGSKEFIEYAVEKGVSVSLGHTVANYDVALEAFKQGANHITHLYNGMPSLHHREPGVIAAAWESKDVYAELICDGVHISAPMVRLAFSMFGKERMVLISDSLRATGMPDGQYPFGGQEIEVHGNRATILGHPETLAGSVTSLMGCLRQAVSMGIPLADAVRACTYNPAASIGLENRIGSFEIGKEASAVLLDKDTLEVRTVIFKGVLIQ